MVKHISYRLARRKDAADIASLLNEQYQRKHTAKYCIWQFFDSFYPTISVLAHDGDRIVGAFGMQRRRLNDGTSCGHLIDLIIDPEYRGLGIFTQQFEIALNHFSDLDAITVLPNLNGKNACVKSLGMRSIAKIDDLTLPSPPGKGPIHIPAITPTSSKLLAFVKGPSYRTWRYQKNPQSDYFECGSATCKLFSDPSTGESFADVVDWASCNKEDVFLSIDRLSTRGLTMSVWALPHSPEYASLRTLGFVHRPRERYFCVKTLKPNKEYLYDINRWRLSASDAEFY